MRETIRFSQVVERSGQPEPFTLWVKPEKDRKFQSALKDHRVLTVHQDTVGSKADYGTVGFTEDSHAQFLIFPKSLKRFEGKRIVGVKYELLKEDVSPKKKSALATLRPTTSKKPAPAKNVIHVFRPSKASSEEPPRAPNATELATELKKLKQNIRSAVTALEKEQTVTAYNILKELVDE
jgi:hypothetical protein